MIVLDEMLGFQPVAQAIGQWYPGAVSNIKDQRPHGRLLDPEIPVLLLQMRQPTFVTLNYRHFFDRKFLHAGYCIICLKLAQQQATPERVSTILRSILRLPQYRTKAKRLGKVISWTETAVTHLQD